MNKHYASDCKCKYIKNVRLNWHLSALDALYVVKEQSSALGFSTNQHTQDLSEQIHVEKRSFYTNILEM